MAYRDAVRIPDNRISVNGSQWVQFPVESFCKQPCLEHIQLIRSGFIVSIHQHPRACTIKTTARKLTGYNSAFSFDDFLQGFMICPQEWTASGGKYENIFPIKILLRNKSLKPDIVSCKVYCGAEANQIVSRQVYCRSVVH